MCPDFRGKILGKILPYIQIMRNSQILGILQETYVLWSRKYSDCNGSPLLDL